MEAILFYLVPVFCGIAFLASLDIYFRPPVESYFRVFSFYLLYDFISQTYGDYQALHHQNTILYSDLTTLVSSCFYIYLMRVIIRSRKAKLILLYCLIAFPLISAINIFLVQNSGVFQTMTYSLGCLLIVGACIYYFWELFQSKKYINLAREPTFWICSGLLFFYTCLFPVYGLINYIGTDKAVIQVILVVLDFVGILLYLSFTIAFLCRLRPTRIST
ncbi:MAG TPA: hypothetical protein VNV35_11320 [Puia sp.]|nr:hypothetical protein [Puia sp.]